MAYGYIDPNQFATLNPAQQTELAIRNGYTGTSDYHDQLNRGGGGSSMSSADSFLKQLKDELSSQFDELAKRTKEFDANNPFSFDEALAKASAEERYNPYYSAELQDFTQGIERQRQSTEGQMKLLTDLNKVQVGADKRALEDAINASEEGFAGAGLFSSGARERATGQTVIQGQDTANTRAMNYNAGQAEAGRTLTGLGQQFDTGVRKLTAQKTTDISTEIERQKSEEEARHATERMQYIGSPYTSSVQNGINGLITGAFGNY